MLFAANSMPLAPMLEPQEAGEHGIKSCLIGMSGRGFVGTKAAAQTHGQNEVRLRTEGVEQTETIRGALNELVRAGVLTYR